jgi:hypothetical protein
LSLPREVQSLLVDGARYIQWAPQREDDLERQVKEHSKDIFGVDSTYLDLKQRLRSKAGIGSIPDGFVLTFGSEPRWFIAEVELSSHPLYDHIAVQLTKFMNGVANPNSQREIVNAIYDEIGRDEVLKAWIKNRIGAEEIHRFLSNLISRPPVIAIVIDERTDELQEVCSSLPGEKTVLEFKTFVREGVGIDVHAHVCHSLIRPQSTVARTSTQLHVKEGIKPGIKPQKVLTPSQPPPSPNDELEITVQNPSFIKFHLFYIPNGRRGFFPGYKIPFKIETDIGEVETYVSSAPLGTQVGDPEAGKFIQSKLAEWYRRHPNIKVGDKVVFTAIEPMKRYRLKTP